MVNAFIGLGSNLDDPKGHVVQALKELSEVPNSQLLLASKLYLSKPVGPQNQDDFVNAVALISTELDAHALLNELQALEQKHQRVRIQHWGPRTLDLDLLLYGNENIHSARLTVPHVEIANRSFVLQPLAEIAPELIFPNGIALQELLRQCPTDGLVSLEDIASLDP